MSGRGKGGKGLGFKATPAKKATASKGTRKRKQKASAKKPTKATKKVKRGKGDEGREEKKRPVKAKSPTAAKRKAQSRRTRIIFMGNPGAGKSTILNSLIQKSYFKAGKSNSGDGVTREMNEYEVKSRGYSVTYVDTPGLDEFGQKKAMASEISKSIVPKVTTILVFVIPMMDGRVDNNSVRSMRIILNSMDKDYPFRVVFNKHGSGLDKKALQDRHNDIFDSCGFGPRQYTWIPIHLDAVANDMYDGLDASQYNTAIHETRTCTTAGVKIELKHAESVWAGDDENYESEMGTLALRGEGIGLKTDFVPFGAAKCDASVRRVFGDNATGKPHCPHCVWYKVMQKRGKPFHAPDESSGSCLYCHLI